MEGFQLNQKDHVIDLPSYIRDDTFLIVEANGNDFEEYKSDNLLQNLDQQLIIDNSVDQEINNFTDELKIRKHKGGWPKGKKRKREVCYAKIPKAPTTGYLIFMDERRKWYKATQPELEFAIVTKLLGKEWSNLNIVDKKKYLEKAEVDKKRYREELNMLKNQNLSEFDANKKNEVNQTNIKAQIDNDQNNNEEANELYCKVCDQLFFSHHNKNEHILGRHHLQMVAEKLSKSAVEKSSTDLVLDSTASGDSKSLDRSKPTNINQAILDFVQLSFDRNEEIKSLTENLQQSKRKYEVLKKEFENYEEREKQLRDQLNGLNLIKTSLKDQLETLRMVPSLFGVINFQH